MAAYRSAKPVQLGGAGNNQSQRLSADMGARDAILSGQLANAYGVSLDVGLDQSPIDFSVQTDGKNNAVTTAASGPTVPPASAGTEAIRDATLAYTAVVNPEHRLGYPDLSKATSYNDYYQAMGDT